MMKPTTLEIISTLLFFLAIFHTFMVSRIEGIARSFRKDSFVHNVFHLLSEVEIVFALWASVFLVFFSMIEKPSLAIDYLDSLSFHEPMFVFVIMCMASTRPIIYFAEKIIHLSSRLIPKVPERMAFYMATLVVGPILGSFITEPAAMTVTALILLKSFYRETLSQRLKYATLALLFVNVSIGGTLTHFAAPPVLMVAKVWSWDSLFMLKHFGYKAVIAIVISTFLYAKYFEKELRIPLKKTTSHPQDLLPNGWIIGVHLFFLFSVVYSAHHPRVFMAIFFLFLGFVKTTHANQDKIQFKEALLVALFLSGLIVLGSMQAWWLRVILSEMNEGLLFLGAAALTSITDNASLTYLGSLVELSDLSKYALVAGAVTGGGLTVIANAPNPAGFGILRDRFGPVGINPLRLFLWALIPTTIAGLCLFFLPNL